MCRGGLLRLRACKNKMSEFSASKSWQPLYFVVAQCDSFIKFSFATLLISAHLALRKLTSHSITSE